MSTQSDIKKNNLIADLGDIYSFVKGQEFTKSILGYTLDHYIEEAKDEIKSDSGTSSSARPTKLQRLANLQTKLNRVMQQAKNMTKS